MNPDKMLSSGLNTNEIVGILGEVTTTVALAGSTQSDATQITREINVLASGTGGVRFPRPTHAGQLIKIFNYSGVTATVYPSTGGAINGGTVNAGISMTTSTSAEFVAVSNLNWYSQTAAVGDTAGAASSTDNAVARFDLTTGKLLQDSVVIVGDAGEVTGVTTLVATGLVNISAAGALTAIGADRAGSLALTKNWNNITTAGSGTGVTLPAATAGRVIGINNAGANAIQVYGASTDTVDGQTSTTGVALTNTKRCLYICFVAGAWISAQLGVVSA